jgi:hypothetical protein
VIAVSARARPSSKEVRPAFRVVLLDVERNAKGVFPIRIVRRSDERELRDSSHVSREVKAEAIDARLSDGVSLSRLDPSVGTGMLRRAGIIVA